MTFFDRVLVGSVLGVVVAMCSGCPGNEPACSAGATRACPCIGGSMGVQTCNVAGTGWESCMGCDSSDSGTTTDSGNDVVSDVVSDPCASHTDCASCASGATCGWCNGRCMSGASTGSSDGTCTGTNWTWHASACNCARGPEDSAGACGDGCDNDDNGYWDCGDFACCGLRDCPSTTSCGRRQMCTGCGTGGTCSGGAVCAQRYCDGREACVVGGSRCTTIDGFACPAVSVWDRCTTDAECGPLARCLPYTNGVTRCVPPPTDTTSSCGGSSGVHGGCCSSLSLQCPPPPEGATGVTSACSFGACVSRSSGVVCDYECVLTCAAGASCPYGMHCSSGLCTD